MKKRFSKALALLLAVVMVISLFPAVSFATEEGESATLINGLPSDGSYGVIYYCGATPGAVMGADVSGGTAPAKTVQLSADGSSIPSLPNGAAVFKFLHNSDGTYYLMVGSQYLAITLIDNRSKIVLQASAEGAKWDIEADGTGAYTIASHDVASSYKYLEYYQNAISAYKMTNDKSLFQFKFFSTSADEDGRVGEIQEAGALPVSGKTYVVYNHYAKAVMGQPTGADAAAPALLPAAATLASDGTLPYENIADGGMIFTVTVTGSGTDAVYVFENNGKYLAMPENTVDENGKTNNDETLLMIDELTDYARWTLEQIAGGYVMYNVAARYGTGKCCVEYFNDVFSGWTYKAATPELFAMNFYVMSDREGTGYVVNPRLLLESPDPAIGSDCEVKFKVDDLNEVTSVYAEYYTTDGSGTQDTPCEAVPEMNNKIGSFTIPASALEGKAKLTVRVTVTDAMNLTFGDSVTVEIRDEPLILSAVPAANSATGDNKRPEIAVTFANVGEGASFVMKLDEQQVSASVSGDKLSFTPNADLEDGKHAVSVVITRADGKSVSKNWTFFVGEGGETLYFGQIHAHTAEYSDGAGTLEEAYEHAHGVDDLDFIIVTDHSNYFDTTATATTSSYYDLSSLSKNPAGTTTKWEEARATAKAYNEQYDDFLCLYGYEMTWSGGPGHTNTFNTYGVVSRNNKDLNNKTGYAGMHLYNDLMVNADKGLAIDGTEAKATRGGAEVTGVNATKYIPFDEAGNPVPVISQFNHPGKTFGNFDNYAGYSSKRDDVLNLIEVGNGEGKVGGSAYFPSYEEYDLCLSMGWHVGPTNNQDNHKGNWGDSNTCRDVILIDDFSEIGLYRALDQRRIYSTEDQNLRIFYELEANGQVFKLGDIAPFEEDSQPKTVTVKLNISDPDRKDKIKTVEVIGEGHKVVASAEVNASEYQGELTISNTEGYYYVRVTEADGDIAVTAPVWVKEAIPVAASLETSASVAAQGEEETVIATLTNGSETEPLTLTGYEVTAEGRTLESKTGLDETVAPGTDKVLNIPFTPEATEPSAKKTYDITVTFHVVFKGKELTYAKTISETSYPPELMTYIGLDAGHNNFYVQGGAYAGNDGSFIQVCADNGIICQYIKAGEMTKENLAKYKLVLITVPFINESTQPTVWTAEELAALKDYADNGGSVICFSKSDRQDYTVLGADGKDTYEFASATMSNLINEAVGGKARFIRGIVVDNDRKANEAYRVYFDGLECVTDGHPFTQAIVAATNGQYQWYNGTGVTVPEGVTALIKPYSTTWVASYKDNFTGSSYEPDYDKDTVMAPKGEFGLVTYEDLPGGGFLVCAGATFISNYDVKAGEAAAQQYENYQLVLNILEYVKNGNSVPAVEITPIAEVHSGAEEGKEFTIEGWVTSNASDYDKDTAFFDCIYMQDETRGINCFPVSGYFFIGEKVRVHGGVTWYCGEIELNLSPEYNGYIQVISNETNEIEPRLVTCAEAVSDDNIGNLMKIKGTITDIHRTEGVIDYIYVDDGSGEIATLFINNYIQKESHALDNAEIGMMCEGVGIGSRDVDENDTSGNSLIRRLRVRARDEIKVYNDPCAQFTDVDRNAWYHDGVDYAITAGIMEGTSDTTFEPNGTLTRGQLVTILYRLDGKPEITASNPFTDVPNNTWYTEGVIWASSVGITDGVDVGVFAPNMVVTREQLATFLFRYVNYAGYDTSASDDLAGFPDTGSVSSWALDAMRWAVGQGLINGTDGPIAGKDYLMPKNPCTRAMFATILMRFDGQDVDNKADIVILYTNDVHCAIDHTATSFGYAGLAAYKAEMEQTHNHVGLVDAGDFIQGGSIGSLSKGAKIIPIMNQVGYEVVTLGNHEFDYSVSNILDLTKQAEFEFVTCNWIYTGPEGAADAVDLEAYKLVEYGDVTVAYVGITTPESLVKSTPTYFQNENGEWIYDFCNDEDGTKLYQTVQTAVDAALAEGADYVVALSHLGTDAGSAPWRSTDVIRNTSGIDVFLDGHSHSVIASQTVANKDGKDVLLTSTGTQLANVGKLTIDKDGNIKTELISRKDYDGVDEETESFIEGIKAEYQELLSSVVVEDLPYDLVIANPDRLDDSGNPVRAVRYQETNLGDVCADAYVYASGADIAFVNGGGVRKTIKAGQVTFQNIIDVHPFGNELVVVEATGRQILDALEMAARNTYIHGETMIDKEGNEVPDPNVGLIDGENGGFLQVSGLQYTIYTGTASTVKVDTAGMYAGVTGERRVGDVKVLNKDTGAYEPIDPEKTYTLASHNYMLKQGGDGLNMFQGCRIIRDGGMLDNEVLINYFQSELCQSKLAAGDYEKWDGDFSRIKVSADEVPAPEEPPEEDEYRYELTTTLTAGDEIVIYHPAQGKALNDTLNGKKLDGVAVTVADGLLTPAEGTAIYTVEYPEGDTVNFYLKQQDGKYLTSAPTGNGLSLEETPNEFSLWYLEMKDEATGLVFVRSTNAAFNGNKNQALEYYGGYTTYGWKDNDAYHFQLYKKVKVEYGYQLKTALAAEDKVVIYHPAQGKALNDTLNGKKLDGVAVTVADGLLTPAEGTAIYTVEYPEGDTVNFYLKQQDGKYLTSAPTGNGLSLEETPNEFSLWYLEMKDEATGLVFVRSTNAAFNGNKNQALEYYGGYTTYGWKDNDAYHFQLYVYGEIKEETEVITSSLEALIAEAEAIDVTLYTEESVAVLTAALAAAREVLEKEDKTQEEVNEATAALRAAIDGLVRIPAENADVYELVTEAPEDWSGTYLIACTFEGVTYVFNGNEEINGHVIAVVEDNKIAFLEGMAPVEIEAMEGGYSLHVANGYMYNTASSNKNQLLFDSSAKLATIALDEDGNAVITSDTTIFRFNKAENQLRFRFYKPTSTSMPLVQLYKLVENDPG